MNVAIVGYGKMGKFYDNLLMAKYLVDVRPVQGRVCFSYVDEFISYGQPVDLVIVSTPSDTHFAICQKLLHAGYDVLVEKPICLSSLEARILEDLAESKGLVLYQTTLERYNPLVKFLAKNVLSDEVARIESYRFGTKPPRSYVEEPKFDLGIHDVDLWCHLYRGKVEWEVNVGFGEARREIIVNFKNGKKLKFDLLHKFISCDDYSLDFTKASSNNPILEMIYDLRYKGHSMNERWSEEIQILEKAEGDTILLA